MRHAPPAMQMLPFPERGQQDHLGPMMEPMMARVGEWINGGRAPWMPLLLAETALAPAASVVPASPPPRMPDPPEDRFDATPGAAA